MYLVKEIFLALKKLISKLRYAGFHMRLYPSIVPLNSPKHIE